MNNVNNKHEYSMSNTKDELLRICADIGIEKYKSKNKTELIKLIDASLLKTTTNLNDNNLNCKTQVKKMETRNDVKCKVKYFEKIDKIIKTILSRPEKNVVTYDILDTEKSKHNKLIILKEKQRQMKIGEIWQEVLGNYYGYVNLKTGHATGLDIISYEKKIAIELKNRTNTDNSSSRKSNLDKLSKFKKEHPDYICIYANINADTQEKTLKGITSIILHNDAEIHHMIGYGFLIFILGDDMEQIIEFVRNTIDTHE